MTKHIVLACGFEADIDEAVLDDFELFEAIAEVEDGHILRLPFVVGKILGKEQKKALYDFFRDEKTGRVPTQQVSEAIADLLEKVPQVKN